MEKEESYKPSTRWANRTGQEEPETLQSENLFFTPTRGPNTTETLTFLLRGQRLHTIPVAAILEHYYNPDQGIILFCRTGTVQIEGRNLEKLYRQIAARKVVEIREFMRDAQQFFDKDSLFINRINYESENITKLGLG